MTMSLPTISPYCLLPIIAVLAVAGCGRSDPGMRIVQEHRDVMTAEVERARAAPDTILVTHRGKPLPEDEVHRIVAATEAAQPGAVIAWIDVEADDLVQVHLGSGEAGRCASGGELLELRREGVGWKLVKRSQWVE